MMNVNLFSMLSILKDDKDNTSFQVLKDELSNTVANVTVRNNKGELEIKPIYIPKMYISANTYRKIFCEKYPYGRVSIEILHKENGENYSVSTLEEKGQLTQEVVKVSLYENRDDQMHNLPLSEGIGAIYYRAEKEYNNNAVATAQGKAFAVAMKNLGITLSDTEEDREELLKKVDCYIEVETTTEIVNGGSKTYFKSIGKAYPYYEKLKNQIYEDNSLELVLEKEEEKVESESFNTKENTLEENKKMLEHAIHSSMNSFEDTEEEILNEKELDSTKEADSIEEDIQSEEIVEVPEEPISAVIKDEVEVDQIEIESKPIEEDKSLDSNEVSKAAKTPLNLKASYNNPAFVDKFGGKTFEELKEMRSIKWIETLEKIENDMTAKTKKAFNILKSVDFNF